MISRTQPLKGLNQLLFFFISGSTLISPITNVINKSAKEIIGIKSSELLLILKSFLHNKNAKKPKQKPNIDKLITNHFMLDCFTLKYSLPMIILWRSLQKLPESKAIQPPPNLTLLWQE